MWNDSPQKDDALHNKELHQHTAEMCKGIGIGIAIPILLGIGIGIGIDFPKI